MVVAGIFNALILLCTLWCRYSFARPQEK